jgi:peptide/nickel transport system permease protein
MLEVIRQDYIRTARAKGLSERTVIFKHALRNALLPTITLLGLQLPYLIGGSVIVEKIFNIPGMGLMTFQAFLHRDYPVIMAVAVLSAALTLVGLILADVLCALADPRISLEGNR